MKAQVVTEEEDLEEQGNPVTEEEGGLHPSSLGHDEMIFPNGTTELKSNDMEASYMSG